ncbi:MAG TPA: DUF2567 domain-containing protein [Pseudonocardiaceae bacterium]|jgi:hypothetical protein|nr:DUF2567 domain-containing protein [Pseudonocardiaceae bacterium]
MRAADAGAGDTHRLVGPMQRTRPASEVGMSAVQPEVQQPAEPAPSRPGAVVRADLVPSLGVLCVVAVLGLPLGALWSWLAPPEFVARSALAPTPGGVLPFVGESEHRFDDMATFLLFGLAAGVLTGAALWLFRRRRGPLVLVAAVLGSLVAAWLAMRVGLWLAAAHYPDRAATGAPFPRAPVLESAWVIITQPFGVAVTYCITTAWNARDDLTS